MSDKIADPHNDNNLRVSRLDEETFAGLASSWEALLAESRADALFMSWPWMFSWWECWSKALDLELVLLAVYDKGGVLRGLAPFYRHRQHIGLGLSVRRLHMIGNAWRIQPTVRTEYCSLIVDQRYRDRVARLLFDAMGAQDWDEAVLCDVKTDEVAGWADLERPGESCVQVIRTRDFGIRIDTSKPFADWLLMLGKNTRLKLYNRRRYLRERGALSCEQTAPENIRTFLEKLNGFHVRRWGKPCFDSYAAHFHTLLIQRLSGEDTEVILSELLFNSQCIGVQYDIRVGETVYNIQSGYLEDFDPKVSLGTLHLGFMIEKSFADPGVRQYDLLAGYGKKTFFKGHLNGVLVPFQTFQIARKPLLRFIYRYQAILPQRVRKIVNRIFRF